MKYKKIIIFLIVILIILLTSFVLLFNDTSTKFISNLIINFQYNVKVNKKEFGKADLIKTDDGNFEVKLKTDFKKLNEAVDKVEEKIKNSTKESKYAIDYSTNVILDNIYNVKCLLIKSHNPKDKPSKTVDIYYSKNTDQILDCNKIFRPWFKSIAYYDSSKIDFNGINLNKFSITDSYILVGDEKKQVKIDFEKHKNLFRAGLGIPSLYTGKYVAQQIMQIDPNKKHICFTFDDGPKNEYHIKIRDLFNKYKQQTTFFMIGKNVSDNPQMAIDSYKDGHEIEDHSWNHPPLATISKEKQAKEIFDTADIIFKTVGESPKYMRPPYGSFNKDTEELTDGNVALWTIDSEDWKSRNTQKIIKQVTPHIKDGAIVLFHDLYETSYEAASILVPRLIDEGYQFVRFDVMVKYLQDKKI